ncbi:MAG: hypothetical protein ABFR89_10810, partial [Actinomycetota bacterium]
DSSVMTAGRGHDDMVQSLRFTPDGAVLITRGWDGTIRTWDVATGAEMLVIDEPIGVVGFLQEMDVSPDGSLLAAGSRDAARIWHLEAGELLYELDGGDSGSSGVAFIPGRTALAVTSGEIGRAISIWDYEADMLTPIPGSGSFVTAVAVSPDGRYVVASDDAGGMTISELTHDWAEGKYSISGHEGTIWDLVFTGSGLTLASAAEDTVRLWDLDVSGRSEWMVLAGAPDTLSSVAYSPDGSLLARGPIDEGVVIVDALTGEEVDRFETVSWQVPDLTFSPDGKHLAVATASPLAPVQVWNVEAGEPVAALGGFEESPHWPFVWSVQYSPDGSLLGAVVQTKVQLWDANTYEEILTIPLEDPENHAVRELAFHPDGTRFAVRGTSTNSDGKTGDFVNTYNLEGERLLTCCEQWWEKWAASVDYSPDGALLLTSGMNQQTGEGLVVLWDAETGEEVASLPGHPNTAWDAVFSPDGSVIASSSGPDSRIWDALTQEEIVTLPNPSDGIIYEVAFSPDGKRLATTGDFGSDVYVWALDLDDLIEIAESRLTRGFTAAECEAYAFDPCPSGS